MRLYIDLAVACLVGICTIAAILAAAHWLLAYECDNYMETTGRKTKAVFLTCYIEESKGQWYTYEEYKFRNAAKGE